MFPSRTPLRLMCAALLPTLSVGAAEAVDFRRDILPILSDACFHCHGPDPETREAKLRLDERDGLFRTQDGVTVVAPGKPDESELILRILSEHEDEAMPPREAKRQLTADEKRKLRQWVEAGAPWAGHWAFEPMAKPEPPAALRAKFANPIDAFLAARLEREGLGFSPEADRGRLLRRAAFDLTGLPPSSEDVAAFESDRKPGAFERAVDRLLASPRYGERMAAEWLDIARYADTHGYQMDRPRAMWPWRDWVIDAFNRNLPYDRFVTEQLAGDLLPNPTKAQRLATGFNRLHNQNEEGGIVEEEYRVAYVVDRVTTFGTAFLGLTLDCTRCHDHKYDPVTQKDFYSLFAFFQNIDEAGQISYAGFADAMPVPTMLLTTPEQDRLLQTLREQARAAAERVSLLEAEARGAFDAWVARRDRGTPPAVLPGAVAHFDFDAIADGAVANRVEAAKPGKVVEAPKIVGTERGCAAELDGENGFVFPGIGHFKRTTPFSISLWVQPPATLADRAVVLHHTKAPVDAGSRGYEILLEQGRVAFGLHYLWPAASLKIVSRTALRPGAWHHVTVTYDGSSEARGAAVYIDGVRAECEVVRDGLFKDITYDKREPDLAIGHRFRDKGFTGGRVDDLWVFERELTSFEAAHLAGRGELRTVWERSPVALGAAERDGLYAYFRSAVHEPTRAAIKALAATCEVQNALVMSVPEAMVMHELPEPKPAFVLQRGAYDSPGARVTADTPHVLPAFPADAPRNRLGLAHWLTSPEHPLFARVTVNRLWQQLFGRGLVESSDNFGLQGDMPSHPELLDWLAREFIRSGWDVKAMLRLIATSATYRQRSIASPELLARDPQNVLLARGPARRLTGEMLRDQALAVSGLLVDKRGGPPVKPYQPPGLWEEIAMGKPKYEQGTGEDLHRRSLYSFWKRTVPPPTMTIFDAADRNVCTIKRQTTNTPLQALALLNDVQLIEAARRLGERMLAEGGATREAQLAWAYRQVCHRAPTREEVGLLAQLFTEQHALFAAEPGAATELLRTGEAASNDTLPVADRAAATMVAQALLNFDEAVMRR